MTETTTFPLSWIGDWAPEPIPGGAAGIFNSAVAAFAVATAWEAGALDALDGGGTLDVPGFCARRDLHEPSIRSVFAALASVGIVVREGDAVVAGPEFAEVYRAKAFFHWLTIGCGELFANMPRIVRNTERTGDFFRRDAAAIGFACRDINRQAFDPVFADALADLDFPVTKVADLGCGSGGRLIDLARRFPGVRGVGVDIAPAVLRSAASNTEAEGLGFEFVEADVRALGPSPRFDGVELLTCFMMGHDFWPRERCVATLRMLREAFPDARRFLLGDTARVEGVPDREKPVFTLGFETAHDLMGVDLPTLSQWDGVFAESGWRLLRARPVEVPAASVIFELS
ncbi:methyltransferase domain-containing protein [Amycolatopsis sp. NBC_00348]|uniref:class I SAM-dependent methyltransferase n=1 Tax=Amycolatopsis sp. NBC_00348 TaxID=2975956 RepID=UPI002E27287C